MYLFSVSCVVDCGPLDPPLNGFIFINSTTIGSEAIYTCGPGFAIVPLSESGEVTRVCESNGNWTGEEPLCIG